VVFPYEMLNIQLQVNAITKDLRIGRNITQLPTGFTASIGTHVPYFVTRGDEFILGLELTNLLEFPQTISIDLVKQDLQIIDVLTKEITLGVGETKKVSWQVLANKEGIETINFQIKNPAGKTIEITRDILVNQLPKFDFNVINGSTTVAGEDEYYFGIVNKNSYVDGIITTYIIPNLSSSLMAGTEKINLESLSIEQKAWTLLAILHIEEMVQVSGSVEETIKEKLSQQAQELVQSLLLTQNIDGGWSKIVGYASDPTITAFSSWALKLSENFYGKVSRESLDLAMNYMINNMGSPDSFEDVSQFDQLAILTFVVKLLDSEKVNPGILLPFLEFFSTEGKIFLSMALEIDNRGNEQSRTIIKEIERNINIENTNLIIENDGLLLNSLNTFTSQMALEIYALSIIDPASAILNEAIQLIMNAQKAPGQWANILESRLCLMAISKYIIGTGQTNGNYEYQAYLNDREILEGSNTSINFLSPISSQFVISQNEPDLIYNQKFSRTEGNGTLFYMTLISVNKLPQQISSRDSGFTIQRFYYLDENTNNMSDCYKGLCYGDNLTVLTNRNQPVQVLLIITTSKDQLNVTLEEHLPAGITLIENSLQENFSTNNYYQPIIDYSKNDIHYQSHSYDAIKWFSEELPAGTYVVSYLINPEFIGQFSVVPANIWARFESINPSWSKGQLLTIINN